MDTPRKVLKRYWGYDDFRGIQRDIIDSLLDGHDTLGLMPTGGGKSICFQVPALMLEGVCIVITPLIALMKDQVAHLRKRGILASAIYSGMSRQEIITVLENAIFGGVKLLYVSPERLASEIFQVKLRHMQVSFITVDEAHCISQWGYDFRPSYLEIAHIREIKPGIPVLALTATATPQVADDIQHQLAFTDGKLFRMSFQRKNLSYVVRTAPDKEAELLHILRSMGGSAIVYVRSRRRTKEIAELLTEEDIPATHYHAGLEPAVKDERQKAWHDDQVRVMVATNAFGMGIDKPDVRLVIHIDCPDSPEAYFQEAGRAGRDGQRSWAVLLYNSSDQRKLHKRVFDTFPEKETIREIYDHLAYFFEIGVGSGRGATFAFDIEKFCRVFRHFPVQAHAALQILDRCGYIHYDTDPDNRSRLFFLLNRFELNQLERLVGNEERVITALLRLYGGLFTDYCYIEESYVAVQAKLTRQEVYETLKELRRRHILDYVPQSSTPLITYTLRREDGCNIVIPPSVYEERRAQYEARINYMLRYATDSTVCRSRQLLDYFGETDSEDCGHCDVCLKKRPVGKDAREQILELLGDGRAHPISELRKLSLPKAKMDEALEWLVQEEKVFIDGGELRKK